jgi:hypothetical protein
VASSRRQFGRPARSTLKRTRRVLAAIVLVASCWQSATAASVSEHRLKAAFLYNFTKFVEWPPERFTSATDPIVIGLLADEALQMELLAIVANRQVNGRALIVRRVASAADMQAVHVLFVGAQQESRFLSLRKQTPLESVLTVGDDQHCGTYDGGICFSQQGEKLRFEINMDTVERSQLKISAQLQKLALAVNKSH